MNPVFKGIVSMSLSVPLISYRIGTGHLWENGYNKSFNGKLQDELMKYERYKYRRKKPKNKLEE
jgi:hypothetical protein